MEIFRNAISQMLLLFCFMIIGYLCNKIKITPQNTDEVLSKLETSFFVPALVLNTFINNCSLRNLLENSHLIMFSSLLTVIEIIVAFLIGGFFSKDKYTKNIYIYSLIFSNFGFLGYSIVEALFGNEGLYRFILFAMPLLLTVYTLGTSLLIPDKRNNVFSKLINPSFVSVVIGLILGLLGIKNYLPKFILNMLAQLSNCMGPIAMVLTGFTIGNYSISSLLHNKKVYILTFLRLIIIPALFVIILHFLKTDKSAIVFTLFAFAAPVGLNTIVFPKAYGGDTEIGASLAMISHLLSVVTLPLMYMLINIILNI